MKQITHSANLRARAWEAMKGTWPTVLALSYVINLVSSEMNQLVIGLPEPVSMILSFVITAAMMVPMLGVTKGMLGYFRGKPLGSDCVKGMLPYAWKVICFYFWELLCIMGWTALGMIPMIIAIPMLPFEMWSQGSETMANIGVLLMLAGLVLMLVLAFRAMLNYSMANCILVDDPDVGARNALRKSKAMIRGYRWHYVKVGLPMLLVILAAVFIVGMLAAVLPGWLGTLLSAAVTAVSGMMSHYFLPVMYEELRRIGR